MIKVGDKWGAMQCVKIGSETRLRDLGPGMSEEWEMTFYQLRCGCGKEVKVDFTDKPRKRDWQDCGCGIVMSVTDKKSSVALSLSTKYLMMAQEIAQLEWKGNMSACINDLVARGLKARGAAL